MVKVVLGAAIGFGGDRLQNMHTNAVMGLFEGGYSNNTPIYVSTRYKDEGYGSIPQCQISIYDANTGNLMLTTGWGN